MRPHTSTHGWAKAGGSNNSTRLHTQHMNGQRRAAYQHAEAADEEGIDLEAPVVQEHHILQQHLHNHSPHFQNRPIAYRPPLPERSMCGHCHKSPRTCMSHPMIKAGPRMYQYTRSIGESSALLKDSCVTMRHTAPHTRPLYKPAERIEHGGQADRASSFLNSGRQVKKCSYSMNCLGSKRKGR